MDSGMNADGVHTLEELRKLNLIEENLSLAQVIKVIDHLIGCEVRMVIKKLTWC